MEHFRRTSMAATVKNCDCVNRKRAPFTYTWTIENVPKLTYVCLKSPLFVAHSVSKTEWYIKIELFSYLCCSLRSAGGRQDGPSKIDVEFSILTNDGLPLVSERNPRSNFFCIMLSLRTFHERRSEFLPNNTITVQCRLWRKRREIPTTDICYARTRVKTYKRSLLWPVEKFSALKSSAVEDFSKLALDERKVYPLKAFTKDGPSLALILYSKRNFESEDVFVGILTEKDSGYEYRCEMSVLDVNGVVIVSKAEEGKVSYSERLVLEFWKLISKNTLISNKNFFLPNDTLLLRFSFEIYSGDSSSEIEYCTPNVLSFVKVGKELSNFDFASMNAYDSLMFPELFIKDLNENESLNSVEEKSNSNTYKKSCPLKEALRHLYTEATLSDVTLRIGTKLYPAHKNILSSRSPVLMSICSKDVEENIIDINDIRENTLCRLLQYIYTGTVEDLQYENALDLFKAAADYQLLGLKEKCSYFLIVNLSKTNVRDILFLAHKYQDEKLETAAKHFASGSDKDFKINNDSKRFAKCNLI